MNTAGRYTDYDQLAWLYNRYWGEKFLRLYEDVLRDLFVSKIRKDRNVLDLCCGTGQIAHWLSQQGFRVMGIDGSRQMLKLAEANAPDAHFMCRDARSFKIIEMFSGVLCTFDSLNHVTSLAQMGNVFNNVYSAMKSGGRFLFDMNVDEGFRARWNTTMSFIAKDHVLAAEISYDPKLKTATARFATFRYSKRWQRRNIVLTQRAYTKTDIEKRLAKSFFKNIRSFDAQRDFQKKEVGRILFVCEK